MITCSSCDGTCDTCGYDDDFDDGDDAFNRDQEGPNRCPECGGDMTFVREGVYCCNNTNDCDYCIDATDVVEGDD